MAPTAQLHSVWPWLGVGKEERERRGGEEGGRGGRREGRGRRVGKKGEERVREGERVSLLQVGIPQIFQVNTPIAKFCSGSTM